jgi:DNA-cytosine methyltransferase
MNNGINVLSCFDGMSCAQIALERAGIKVNNYYASEVDKWSIKVTQENYPQTQQIGDINKLCGAYMRDCYIDLLIGGSPCQDLSRAGKGKGLDGERSGLFWEYVRLKNELQPRYFLLENVRMKQEYQDIISEALGVKPIRINSNLVSAQNRDRYYWTNIPFVGMPEDKGVLLKDILEDEYATDRDKSYCLDANYFKGGNLKSYFEKHRRQLVFSPEGMCHIGNADLNRHDCLKRVYHPEGKSPTLNACTRGNREPKVLCGAQRGRYVNNEGKGSLTKQGIEVRGDEKTNALTTVGKDNLVVYNAVGSKVRYSVDDLEWRKLTPIECERLQTVPDNYTKSVSNTQRYKMLGNGFTVDVIAHLLKGMLVR